MSREEKRVLAYDWRQMSAENIIGSIETGISVLGERKLSYDQKTHLLNIVYDIMKRVLRAGVKDE
jgi:hypothetical protein